MAHPTSVALVNEEHIPKSFEVKVKSRQDTVNCATQRQSNDEVDLKASYDGSNAVFRLLRLTTWGPSLMNLGYYPFKGPLSFLNLWANVEWAQRRLVIKSVELLDVQRGYRVL